MWIWKGHKSVYSRRYKAMERNPINHLWNWSDTQKQMLSPEPRSQGHQLEIQPQQQRQPSENWDLEGGTVQGRLNPEGDAAAWSRVIMAGRHSLVLPSGPPFTLSTLSLVTLVPPTGQCYQESSSREPGTCSFLPCRAEGHRWDMELRTHWQRNGTLTVWPWAIHFSEQQFLHL